MPVTPIPVTCKPTNGLAGLKMAVAAAQIDAGSVIYINSNGQAAVSGVSTQSSSKVDGVAVTTAEAVGAPILYAPPGAKITASGFTAGTAYYLAANGDICLYSDLVTGEWVSLVAVAESSTVLRVLGQQLNIQK